MLPDASPNLLGDRELLERVADDLAHCRRLLDQIAPYLPLLERAARMIDNPAAIFRRKPKGPSE
jgi:hypothetical protein